MKAPMIVILLTFAAWAHQSSDAPQDPPKIEPLKTTIVITARPVEPGIDRRNSEVFTRTSADRGGGPHLEVGQARRPTLPWRPCA